MNSITSLVIQLYRVHKLVYATKKNSKSDSIRSLQGGIGYLPSVK